MKRNLLIFSVVIHRVFWIAVPYNFFFFSKDDSLVIVNKAHLFTRISWREKPIHKIKLRQEKNRLTSLEGTFEQRVYYLLNTIFADPWSYSFLTQFMRHLRVNQNWYQKGRGGLFAILNEELWAFDFGEKVVPDGGVRWRTAHPEFSIT